MNRFRLGGRKPATPDTANRGDWPALELDQPPTESRLPDLPPWFLDQLGLRVETAAARPGAPVIADLRRKKRPK